MKTPCSLTVILLFPLLVNAYTWKFTSQPIQCSLVGVAVQGSGGQPPYSFLILPTGASPLPGNVEVRPILEILFAGTSTSIAFTLNYPQDSTFVAVVSDKSGYGTGGASTSITVLRSSDSSCYNTSKPWHPKWFFNINPAGGLTQCESVRNWWEAPDVDGTVSFYGTIPGGTSFTIPQGSLSTNANTGTGFSWTVNIAAGNSVILIGNDAAGAGIGNGGSAEFTIGSTNNASCLHDNSPSSTPGNPAGSYPTGIDKPSSIGSGISSPSTSLSSGNGTGSYSTTSTSGSSSFGSGTHSNSSSSHTGGIVGGVLGAAILLLVAFWLIRRRRYPDFLQKPGPAANTLPIDEGVMGENPDHRPQFVPQSYVPQSYGHQSYGHQSYVPQSYVPQSYMPEPYNAIVPMRIDRSHPTTSRTSEDVSVSTRDRLLSLSSATGDIQSSQTPPTPPSKTQSPPSLNIIQHEDAGPSDDLSSKLGLRLSNFPLPTRISAYLSPPLPFLLPVAEDES